MVRGKIKWVAVEQLSSRRVSAWPWHLPGQCPSLYWACRAERLKRNGEVLLEAWLAEFKVRAKVRNAMPGIEQESVGLFEVKIVRAWELWELKALASPLRLEVKFRGQRLFLRAIVPDPSFEEWQTGLERSYGAECGLTWLQNWVIAEHTMRVRLWGSC